MVGSRSVYLSIPVLIGMDQVTMIEEAVGARLGLVDPQEVYNISRWGRNKYYDPELLREADFIVVVLPDFAWSGNKYSVPVGVKAEIETATRLRKKIFLMYKNMSGELNIYETKTMVAIDGFRTIKGIQGTTPIFTQEISKKLSKIKEVSDNKPVETNSYVVSHTPKQLPLLIKL